MEGGAEGIETLRESLAVLEGSSARLERARTLVELGAALRRSNQRADARELLKQGLDLAVRSRALPLVERAEQELAATGARPRRLLLSGVESLTASERRVAGFAAEGLSNKDIAQALFVTTKTVEVHLSNVYRKLGIGSRSELPQALRRRGLMRLRRKGGGEEVRLVLVATDLSETAERAVRFAAEMASRYEAELLVLRVLVGERRLAHGSALEELDELRRDGSPASASARRSSPATTRPRRSSRRRGERRRTCSWSAASA